MFSLYQKGRYGILATVGIIKSIPTIVIGAMVIATWTVTAVSFASVLGDLKLIRQSIITSLVEIGIPVVIAAIFSFFSIHQFTVMSFCRGQTFKLLM